MARGSGFHVVDLDAQHDALLDDELPEWEPPTSSVAVAVVRSSASSSVAVARTLGSTVSAAESAAMHRPDTNTRHAQRFGVGAAGLMSGANNVHCGGCRERPWPDCAACGKPAIIALPDPDQTVPHSMPLCAGCWAIVLDWREHIGQARAHPKTRRDPHTPYSAEELARIRELRLAGKLWREIAVAVGGSIEGARKAYLRTYDRERWLGRPSPRMVSSRPDTPRILTPSVVPVPKTRQRPAQSCPVGTTTNLPDARASVKPRNRKASPVVRPPLIVTTATAAAKTVSSRKYNTDAPETVKRATKRRAVS